MDLSQNCKRTRLGRQGIKAKVKGVFVSLQLYMISPTRAMVFRGKAKQSIFRYPLSSCPSPEFLKGETETSPIRVFTVSEDLDPSFAAMVYDSFTNVSIPGAPNVKDLGRKKRANRSAKLKQSKLDVRREQWLSQVKKKECMEEWTVQQDASNGSSENLEARRARVRSEGNGYGSIHLDSDSELSPSNSPSSFNSILVSNDSGTNYSGSSSSSAGCCSGNITEEDDDGCLDDWEAMADALATNDERQKPPLYPPPAEEPTDDVPIVGMGGQNPRSGMRATSAVANTRAWRPDDAFRPQSLPNLTKHRSFPSPSDRFFFSGGIPWAGCNRIFSTPTSCPICCEDLDPTDSSFFPCPCGFKLCLFCHKRILEEDGRCPGCRKPYEHNPVEGEASVQGGNLTIRLTRSHSLMMRP